MIKADIVCGEFRNINGANRVVEKLIAGKDMFLSQGICLGSLYTSAGVFLCDRYVSPLGNYSEAYGRRREKIEKWKKRRAYRTYPVQAAMQLRALKESEKGAGRYLASARDADCVIFNDVYAAYAYLKKRKKKSPGPKALVITHADTDPLEQTLINRPELKGTCAEKRLRAKYDFALAHADKVVSICRASQKYIWEHQKIQSACIYNGVEDIPYEKRTARDPVLHFAELGTVMYRKGQDLVIGGLAKLTEEERKRIQFHFIGNGKSYREIVALAAEKGVSGSCVFHGEVKDPSEILKHMDVMLLPSRAEAVPLSIIEGLRQGLPGFSTNVGEIPFMIDGCGEVIEPTADGVYAVFRRTLNREYDLEKLSVRARQKYLECFTLEKMVSSYANAIKSMFDKA